MPFVTIFQSPGGGARRALTDKEVLQHRAAGIWPRDADGRELCNVYRGRTYRAPETAQECETAAEKNSLFQGREAGRNADLCCEPPDQYAKDPAFAIGYDDGLADAAIPPRDMTPREWERLRDHAEQRDADWW